MGSTLPGSVYGFGHGHLIISHSLEGRPYATADKLSDKVFVVKVCGECQQEKTLLRPLAFAPAKDGGEPWLYSKA